MSTIYYPLSRADETSGRLILEEYGANQVSCSFDDSHTMLTEAQLDVLTGLWASCEDPGWRRPDGSTELSRFAPDFARLYEQIDSQARLQVLRALCRAQMTMLRWRLDQHYGHDQSFIDVPAADEQYGYREDGQPDVPRVRLLQRSW